MELLKTRMFKASYVYPENKMYAHSYKLNSFTVVIRYFFLFYDNK